MILPKVPLMPLTPKDRQFLQIIGHLKIYLLLTALAVFLYLLCSPATEIRSTTTVICVALCAVFWLTQRLLSLITLLDLELTRMTNALKHALSEKLRK